MKGRGTKEINKFPEFSHPPKLTGKFHVYFLYQVWGVKKVKKLWMISAIILFQRYPAMVDVRWF